MQINNARERLQSHAGVDRIDPTKFLSFEHDRTCPLCDHSEKVVLSHRMQFHLDCTTVICRNCGFCYVSPPPKKEAYLEFYREAYPIYYQRIHEESPSEKSFRENKWEKSRLDLIEKYKTLNGAKVLEIGPGRGHFLQLAANRGAQTYAIEPSESFRKILLQSGATVVGDYLENVLSDQRFDIVMLFQVLEHFHDPVGAINRIRELLADDGVVVLDVPNIWKPFRSLDRYFLRYVHPSYFSPQTLKRLLTSQQLEILHLADGGPGICSPSPILAVAQLSKPDSARAELPRDDGHALKWHLWRYRVFYPCFYFPVYILWRHRKLPRKIISKSILGKLYRLMKGLLMMTSQ